MFKSFLNLYILKSLNIIILFLCILYFFPSPASAATVSISRPQNYLGLVGYWTFDGKDMPNGLAKDLSGNGNDGKLVNIATSTFYRPGKIGQGLNFDGIDDVVNTGDIAAAENTNTITVAAWVKPSVADTAGIAIVNKSRTLSGFSGWNLYRQSTEKYEFRISDGASSPIASSDTIFSDTSWHHVVGVYNGVDVRIYVDGVSADATPPAATFTIPDAARTVCIGGAQGNSTICGVIVNSFPGLIDDVRIYSRAFSASEVTSLYNAGSAKQSVSPRVDTSTGLSRGLVGYWTFDGKDMPNGLAKDVSGNGNNGSLVSMSTSTVYVAGKLGQALKFDAINANTKIAMGNAVNISGANGVTLSAWVKPAALTAASSNAIIWRGVSGGAVTKAYSLYLINPDEVRFRVTTSSTGADSSASLDTTTSPISALNTWYHVMGVYSDADDIMRIYVNGREVASDGALASGTMADNASLLHIGAAASLVLFKGSIDDVRIYNRALSASEVLQLYNSGSAKQSISPRVDPTTGLSKGLVGYWTFDGKDMPSGKVNDISGSGNHGSFVSMSTSTTYVAGKIGQGLNFNGANSISMGDVAAIDTATALSSCSWVKHSSIQTDNEIIAKNSGSSDGFSLFRDDDGFVSGRTDMYKITVLDSGSTNSALIEGATNSSPLNKWTYVCFTYTANVANGLHLYVNGVEDANSPVSTIGITAIDAGTNPLRIGALSAVTNLFVGQIDDVRVFTRMLSASEVLQLYNSGK